MKRFFADQNGNVKSKTTSNGDGWYYTYSARNQLVKAEQQINGVRTTKATYTYNGKGERVSKTGVGTTYFTRGLAGELLEEITVNNSTVTDRKEYIYLNGEMVAVNQLVPGLVAPRAEEVIVDNVNAVASGSAAWKRTTASTDYGSDYLHFANSNASQPSGRAILTWTPTLAGGDYEVFAWWVAGSNHYSQVPYIITHSGGSTTVYKDQRVSGGQWVSLGRYRFNAGSSGNVRVSSDGVNTTVADAVRFVNLRTPVAGFITNTYYLHNNHLGAPVAATKPNGQVAWRAHYEPFGAVTTQTDVDGDGVAFNLNVRFQGQYYDQETGLHYNYFRDYDPSTGRYLQSDPIGLGGGLNTYAYVEGNPVNKVDPKGLFATLCDALKQMADIEQRNPQDYIWGNDLHTHPALQGGMYSGSDFYNFWDVRTGQWVSVDYLDSAYRSERRGAGGLGITALIIWANTVADDEGSNSQENMMGIKYGEIAASRFDSLMSFWEAFCMNKECSK